MRLLLHSFINRIKGISSPRTCRKLGRKCTVIKRCQEETNPEELGYVFFNGPVSFSLGDVPLLMYPCHLFTIFTHRNGVIETFDSWLFDFARGVRGNTFNNFLMNLNFACQYPPHICACTSITMCNYH